MTRLLAFVAGACLLATAPALCESLQQERPLSGIPDLESRLRSVIDPDYYGMRIVLDPDFPGRRHVFPKSAPWSITCGDTLDITFGETTIPLALGPFTASECRAYSLAISKLL